MRENLTETLVGAGVLAAAATFMVYTANISGEPQGGTYALTAQFPDISGISMGSEVRMAGVRIGSVSEITLDSQTLYAQMEIQIQDNIEAPEDSSALILNDGLLGGAFVAIEPGGALETLQPGDRIQYTQGAVNIMDLIGKTVTGG